MLAEQKDKIPGSLSGNVIDFPAFLQLLLIHSGGTKNYE